MFTFHKPKVYRSANGCCICKAKSSSSRFTDSSKYETEFERCFRIVDDRCGEICNACVLLVKRWKKLPSGTSRHWHHVVDARAGPGTKSTLKLKKASPVKHKHRYFAKKHRRRLHSDLQPDLAFSDLTDDLNNESECFDYDPSRYSDSFPHGSPSISDEDESDTEDGQIIPEEKLPICEKPAPVAQVIISPFLDLTYWKMTQVCCGIIFKGLSGEVLVDPKLLKPCWACRVKNSKQSSLSSLARSHSPVTDSNSSSQGYADPDDDNSVDNTNLIEKNVNHRPATIIINDDDDDDDEEDYGNDGDDDGEDGNDTDLDDADNIEDEDLDSEEDNLVDAKPSSSLATTTTGITTNSTSASTGLNENYAFPHRLNTQRHQSNSVAFQQKHLIMQC